MTTIIEKLNQAKAALEAAQDDYKAEHAAIIKAHCPVKIGDVVECNGYVHTGKKMVVRTLRINKWCDGWEWGAYGPVLKKDGTESLKKGDWARPIEADE